MRNWIDVSFQNFSRQKGQHNENKSGILMLICANLGNRMYCTDPRSSLLHDLPPSEAGTWLKKFERQPASGWDDVIDYCGWREVPSVNLWSENNALLPLELQQQMAALAGCEFETCSAGHMAMLSQPSRVVEVIRKAAGETLWENPRLLVPRRSC